MKILFVGTSSGAGKTTIAAMFCRYLKTEGIKVAPFKASNLSSRSYITKDGKRLGTGQAFQALVSGLVPTTDMNPLLLCPSTEGMKRIVNGSPAEREYRTDELVKVATDAFDRLAKEYEAVVCEGSGSPAELNLLTSEVANMRLAREREIPTILVGDIERGGVFAGIYGTWLLLSEKDRSLIKGFIINRFRGEPSILKKGTDKITELTGMKYMGVMPLMDVSFPEEDMLSKKEKKGADHIAEMDVFLAIAKKNLDLKGIKEMAT